MTKRGLIFLLFTCAGLLLVPTTVSFGDIKDEFRAVAAKGSVWKYCGTADENKRRPVSLQTAVHAAPIFYFLVDSSAFNTRSNSSLELCQTTSPIVMSTCWAGYVAPCLLVVIVPPF